MDGNTYFLSTIPELTGASHWIDELFVPQVEEQRSFCPFPSSWVTNGRQLLGLCHQIEVISLIIIVHDMLFDLGGVHPSDKIFHISCD